jgi:hypothetical protein
LAYANDLHNAMPASGATIGRTPYEIPVLIENTLVVDPGGVVVLTPLPPADRCPVPPLVLPVSAGGAPFERPVALVPLYVVPGPPPTVCA